jgi:lysophospholipase L1-like esterase
MGVNRSEKGDPLLGNVAAVPEKLIERAIGRSETGSRKSAQFTEGSAAAPAEAPPQPINDTPSTVALGNFFRALGALQNHRGQGAVTILHLGDSQIAADRFSGDMREQFQSRFGNAGRGMMMPGLYLARGVKFDQGGTWEVALSTGAVPGPYGVTGVKTSARTPADWLRVTATDRPFTWTEITLETGPDRGSALIALDGEVKLAPANAPTPGWKTIRLEKPAREIVIRPKGDGLVTVHAVAIGERKPGIRYVNLGVPGATAMTPLSWNAAQVADDLQRLAPDLIIVGYGTEESFDDALNPGDYEANAMRMLGLLRDAAPRASLLVLGPPDVARLPNFPAGVNRAASDVCRALSPQERAAYRQRLRNGDPRLARWYPPLRLDEVRQALRRAAAAYQAYFWDWSKLMGGACGVHAWVHSDPPLAAGDHIHLTEEGSKRSARLLFRELMAGYDVYDRAIATADNGAQPALTRPAPKSAR